MCYLCTTHLASSFDVINKGNNCGARIFEIVYKQKKNNYSEQTETSSLYFNLNIFDCKT